MKCQSSLSLISLGMKSQTSKCVGSISLSHTGGYLKNRHNKKSGKREEKDSLAWYRFLKKKK